jgi:acetyltransferase-like isoleucine patch superfamily enzyme
MVQIEIGEHAWIGEGCTIIANVGAGAMTAAASVVAAAVPPRIVVGGNPARFIRKLEPPNSQSPVEERHAALASVR